MEHVKLSERWGFRLFEAVSILAFLLIIFLAVLQVVSRLLPDQLGGSLSFTWTAELATNMFIFVIFVGSAATQIRDEHITITVLRDRITERVPYLYDMLIHLFGLTFSVMVAYAAYMQSRAAWGSGGLAIQWFHSGYLYAFILVGFVLIAISEVGLTLHNLAEWHVNRNQSPDERSIENQ
jgi:TRAP-type C4-dicarboxylate transport system permease small subunit